MFRIIFTALLLTGTIANTAAQDDGVRLYSNGFYARQFTEVSGLAHNSALYCSFNKDRAMWINTSNGVSRFDGRSFMNFGPNEGIQYSRNGHTAYDTLGYIYNSTRNGIFRYTVYNYKTGSYFHAYPGLESFAGHIWGLAVADSNSFIFQVDDGSVQLYKKGKLVQLSGPVPGGCGEVIFTGAGPLYYVYVKDTFPVFNASFKLIRNISITDSGFTGINTDEQGNLLTYYNTDLTLYEGARETGKIKIPDSTIWLAYRKKDQAVFCYRSGKIIQSKQGKLTTVLDLNALSLLCNGLYISKEGIVWVLTASGGIFRISELPYEEYPSDKGVYFTMIDGRKTIVKKQPEQKGISVWGSKYDKVRQTYLDRKGVWWGAAIDGIYRLDAEGNRSYFSFDGEDRFYNNYSKEFTEVEEDDNGDIWFCGKPGLVRFRDGKPQLFTLLSNDISPYLRLMVKDKYGTLFLKDAFNNTISFYGGRLRPATELGIPVQNPGKHQADHKGRIWFSDKNSLYCYEKKGDRYFVTDSIVQNPHSKSSYFKTYVFDKLGRCWMGLANGRILIWRPDEKGQYTHERCVTLTNDDGLGQLNKRTYIMTPDNEGNVVVLPALGHEHQANYYILKPDAVLEHNQTVKPEIQLIELRVNNELPEWDNELSNPYGIPSNYSFSHRNNDISFYFTSSNTSRPAGLLYRTMLEGYDTKWNYTENSFLNYTNLPAGSYTLRIQANDVNGNWGPEYTYPFRVRPPWYRTWWATLLWILIASSLILLFLVLRISYIRVQNLKESNRFKSNLIGLIGHDIVTPLRYIAKVSNQLEVYQEKLSKDMTRESLNDITLTATQLHFFGESIVHWIKTQRTDMSPAMQPFNIKAGLEGLVSFHSRLAADKGNQLQFSCAGDTDVEQDPLLVRIILHNLLLNAQKYTQKGIIHLHTSTEGNKLVLTVSDSGQGMKPETVKQLNQFKGIDSTPGTSAEKGWGMGYRIIHDLLKFTGGQLHVTSESGKGTQVKIILPVSNHTTAVSSVA